MQIENYVMSNTGDLSVEVDTVINPYTVGINSPGLTLVQAIDFIGYDPRSSGGPEGIKYIDNGAKTLATFGLVDKIDIASVSPLVDAVTKYPSAPAGTKLVTKAYNFIVSEDDRNAIIDANTAPAYYLRIRTVMVDISLPSSPAVPNNIVEFNTLVESLGSAQSTHSGHNLYYGCISIPVNGVGRPFLKIDPVMYYDWGSMNDYGIKVTGTSSKSVLPPIQMIFTWNDAHSPTMTISQDGESWEAYINNYDSSYLYIGTDGDSERSCNFKVTYEDHETGLTAGIDTVSEGRLPPASRAIRIGDVGTQIEHIRDYNPPTNRAYEELPVANYDFATGKLSLDTIVKLNRADEIALNGNDLELWVKVHFITHVDGSSYRLDTVGTSSELIIRPGLEIYGLGSLWNDPARRVPYNSVYDGGPEGWQIVKTEMLDLTSLQGDIDLLRAASGDTNTKYVMIVQTIVTRNNSNPPVPYPPNLNGYDTFFQSQAMFDYRNVSYFSINVPMPVVPEPEPEPEPDPIPEETFTVDTPYYYEYGHTANPDVVISGTASGPISVADLSISVLDGNYVDKPLTIHSLDKAGDKWTAIVSDPNVRKVIPGPMHKAYSATDYTTNLFTKLETTFKYTNPTSGKVWEIYTNDINVHCPTQTRAVNIDSPRTTHEVINSFRGYYPSEIGHTGWWSDLPYARLDLDTGVLSVDVIVKLVKPEEIALNGKGLKLWVRTQMDLDTNLTNLVSFDAKKLVTDNALTLNKSLAVIENLGDIWNDPTKVQAYTDKFPDAPVEAKDWKIVKVDIPLGKNFKADTNAARTALGFASLPTTDLLLTIHTFIGRPDMSRTPPYPDSIEAFNKAFIDSLTKYPYALSNDNTLVMRSHLKIDLPV